MCVFGSEDRLMETEKQDQTRVPEGERGMLGTWTKNVSAEPPLLILTLFYLYTANPGSHPKIWA